MDFGITIKPDISIDRILSLTEQAEASGFSYGWIFDSHVLWKDPFPLLTLMAAKTKRMHLGTCVTNPAVRDVTVSASLFATLNLASHGRMELGIGRGDSSRRVLGKKPTTLENIDDLAGIDMPVDRRGGSGDSSLVDTGICGESCIGVRILERVFVEQVVRSDSASGGNTGNRPSPCITRRCWGTVIAKTVRDHNL